MTDPTDRDFTLHHRADVLAIVDRMQRDRTVVTIELGHGQAIVSSVLEVRRDAHAMVFDVARDPARNHRLFEASRLTFVSQLDHVAITFETGTPAPITIVDGPAALVAIPTSIVRLQRREAFRATLPRRPPVRCTVDDHDGHALTAQALDVSATGTALLVDDPGEAAVADSAHTLVMSLPDVGTIEVAATLRTVTRVAGPAARMGYRFESVPPALGNRLQRYVQELEVHRLRMLRPRES